MEANIIPLTRPAVRYAVEVAELFGDFTSTICVKSNEDAEKVFNLVLNYVDAAQISLIDNRSVRFNNGSRVDVQVVIAASKGKRTNLIVYDTRLGNKILNAILRPMLAHYFEKE